MSARRSRSRSRERDLTNNRERKERRSTVDPIEEAKQAYLDAQTKYFDLLKQKASKGDFEAFQALLKAKYIHVEFERGTLEEYGSIKKACEYVKWTYPEGPFEEDIYQEINDWMLKQHPNFYDCTAWDCSKYGIYDAYYQDDDRFERCGTRNRSYY